jgi:endonuclease/exonuclease/phosphatase (EEP) superfamily protein YafD
LAIISWWRRWWGMFPLASLVVLMELIVLFPVIIAPGPPKVAGDAPRLSVRFANLLFDNKQRAAEAATMTDPDVDVVAVAEFHPLELKAFDATGAMGYWPYRVARPGYGSDGVGLFSRYPITSVSTANIGTRPAIKATLEVGGRTVEIFVVHPLPPVDPVGRVTWAPDLEAIRRATSVDPVPTVVVGDFNSAAWHPPFREFLTHGFHDSHIWTGHGLSRSWPMDWPIPPFVRLDHALVRDGVIPTHIQDFTVPGSDHRGFVVDLAITK